MDVNLALKKKCKQRFDGSVLVEVLNVKNQGLVSMCCLLFDRQTIIPSPPGTLDLPVHFEIQWVPLTTCNKDSKKTVDCKLYWLTLTSMTEISSTEKKHAS